MTSITALPVWMTEAQAAEYLGVTDRTVRSRIADGSLPAARLRNGRGIRIKADDVLALFVPVPTTRDDNA